VTRSILLFVMAFTAAVAAAQLPTPQPPTPQPTQMSGQALATPAAPGGSMPVMTPQTEAPLQLTDENRAIILMLLERIQHLTTNQLNEESKVGKVTVNRDQLDEVLANVTQIKSMLQK